ncbi:MAG: VRR-NUC domain-containing protein [Dehalococcoidales bacterium]|jgi:hypothetical protein|nr:VRR-NUC domain-containing protein [Dehalococcoidales bacterium]
MKKTTEKEFRQQVIDLGKLLGYRTYFTWTSIHSPRGFPDLVMSNPAQRRIIFAELKSATGELTESQKSWLETLRECGQEVYVWRPDKLEEIAQILQNKG